ncbi:helix-turn-helix domain-containing protein [Nonomuraea sp. NPDC050536]|uniref:helix-turn-helix domain-containing protein n=1 Tax=Nonomuraea sp. NPDC050536 TaxID=3364366 RepID=UPI0037C930FE
MDIIPNSSSDPLLNRKPAAEVLEVSAHTVWRWAKAGLLPYEPTAGGIWRYRLSHLKELKNDLQQRGQKPMADSDQAVAV